MSFLVTTKNFFETLIAEEHLNKAGIPYTRIDSNYLEIHFNFLTPVLARIFVECTETVINKRQTIDGVKFHQILP